MLTLNFSQLLVQLRGLERSIVIAAVLSVGALIYAGSLGLQWWDNIGQADELRGQIQQLETALGNFRQNGSTAGTTIQEQQETLASQLERFTFGTDDEIIGLADAISRDARVAVSSAESQNRGTRVIGSQVYRVRSATFRLEGQVTRLLDFIDLLSAASPGMGVTSSRMGGFSQSPWMILEVELLLDPQPTGATTGGR
jgi:hypothetical protein